LHRQFFSIIHLTLFEGDICLLLLLAYRAEISLTSGDFAGSAVNSKRLLKTQRPTLQYDRNITGAFPEDDNLFIQRVFPAFRPLWWLGFRKHRSDTVSRGTEDCSSNHLASPPESGRNPHD
jgi:hypothetical protein